MSPTAFPDHSRPPLVLRSSVILPTALLLGACAHAAAVPTPYASDACPLPPDAVGYTVVARAADSSLADQAYLRGAVRAVVTRWQAALKRPGREQPPRAAVPLPDSSPPLFWRAGWRPLPGQRADVEVTIRRDGTWTAPRLVSAGDVDLDRAALDAVASTARGAILGQLGIDTATYAFPARAAAAGADSVVVRFLFGERPRPGETAVARFAVQERPVRPRSATPPTYPEALRQAGVEGSALMQFVVDAAGRVAPHTIRTLRASDPAFAEAVVRVLPSYRFASAVLDCAPAPQLVQLPFTFGLVRARPSGP